VKQRVLQTDVAASAAIVERIRRADEPERIAELLVRLNA
jgi:hypothetical protein